MARPCPTCGGEGTVLEFRRFAGEAVAGEDYEIPCPDCGGASVTRNTKRGSSYKRMECMKCGLRFSIGQLSKRGRPKGSKDKKIRRMAGDDW